MEIGVYDGDNAVAMVRVASEGSPSTEVEYYGFDFFVKYSRAQISRKLDETGCKYWLYEGDTLETLPQAINDLPLMDLIFIDGGKSYAEARSDWEHSRRLMHSGSAIYVHNYEFQGVKRMVEGISRREYDVSVIREPYEGLVALVKTKKS
jgi:predicted O-methyltransferase YrrM